MDAEEQLERSIKVWTLPTTEAVTYHVRDTFKASMLEEVVTWGLVCYH
jgi:hypothetical protein